MKKSGDCEVHGAPHRAANRTLLLMVFASLSLIVWHVWSYGPSHKAAVSDAVPGPFPLVLTGEIWDLLSGGHGILAELWEILPYFIAGILLAGYIRTYKIALKLQTTLKRYGILSVFLASVVGMITPLCACGTLTTAISLLFARFPLAPVMALLVTSPLLSPSTYLLTLNDLGPEWTVIRTLAAFSMGMFAGILTHLLRDRGFRTDSIFIEGAIPRGDFHDENYPDERLRCNCKEKLGHRVAARTKNMFVVFLAKSYEMLWLVGKYVLVGVVMGAIVERYMPYEWIYKLFGQKGPFSILWVTLGSVPIFLHQISASSILYHIKSSLDGTLDAGAGLAFMIGGPVTAMPTMVMFWTIFRKKVFFLYMFICIVGTLIISYAFQLFVFVPYADIGNPLLRNVGSIPGGASSVIQKKDKHVRIVMDPGGRPTIATYSNDIGSTGGVIFDSSFNRFVSGPADRFDNTHYISNAAAWLEENNSSGTKGSILIYDTFSQTGLDRRAISGNIVPLLEKKGFRVRLTDRLETPVVTDALLAQYGQLWLVFGEFGAGRDFSDAEQEAIAKFSDEGKGMLFAAGKNAADMNNTNNLAAANKPASRYGIIFSGFADNAEELHASSGSYILNRSAGAIGRILKLFHKA